MAERDDEGFLGRWSRRKRAAQEAARQPEAAEIERQTPNDAPEVAPPEPPTEIADLPDPETLDASSDFSVFLRRDVPIETHRKALRRLWRLDPIYNRLDGLDDYCEDFTDQAKVVKGLRTAYKVGRGFLEQISEAKEPPDEAPATEPATQGHDDQRARIVAGSADAVSPGESEPGTKAALKPVRAAAKPRRS